MGNRSLREARQRKNDEFYTLYEYIQKEVNAYLEYDPDTFRDKVILCPCDDPEWSNFTKFFAQNFELLGLKKLISTSYSIESKKEKYERFHQISIFDSSAPQYDEEKEVTKGKIFTLTRDTTNMKDIDYDHLEWTYLEGDGDFQSDEVKKLRDEADIIVTNPPFSLFRDFVAWVLEANKNFLIVGQIGMATYKEIFPEIQQTRMWVGVTCNDEDMVFEVPEGAEVKQKDKDKAARMGYVGNYTRQGNSCWFTNLDHGRRHSPLSLMPMADNIKYSKHKEIRNDGYLPYYNYDGIDVPFVDAIPSDYDGIMGVPTSFLGKYNPEQFELVDNGAYAPKTLSHVAYKNKGIICYEKDGEAVWTTPYTVSERKAGNGLRLNVNGEPGTLPYGRILIRRR